MKNKVGQPTVMTEPVLEKLKEAFLWGCTDAEACLHAGIGAATLYNYQNANPEYVEQKAAWKENPILLARSSVVQGLKMDRELALKFLERKRRDEFAVRQINETTDPETEKKLDKITEIIQSLSTDVKPRTDKESKTTS